MNSILVLSLFLSQAEQNQFSGKPAARIIDCQAGSFHQTEEKQHPGRFEAWCDGGDLEMLVMVVVILVIVGMVVMGMVVVTVVMV